MAPGVFNRLEHFEPRFNLPIWDDSKGSGLGNMPPAQGGIARKGTGEKTMNKPGFVWTYVASIVTDAAALHGGAFSGGLMVHAAAKRAVALALKG